MCVPDFFWAKGAGRRSDDQDQQSARFRMPTINRRIWSEVEQMMNDYGMGLGMGFGWLWMIVILVLAGLAIAALVKYLRK